jgi:hypothetical protein
MDEELEPAFDDDDVEGHRLASNDSEVIARRPASPAAHRDEAHDPTPAPRPADRRAVD